MKAVTLKYLLTTHFTLLDQRYRKDFSMLKRYAKDSRLNVIPASSFSLFLPPSPPLSPFSLFSPILSQMSLFAGYLLGFCKLAARYYIYTCRLKGNTPRMPFFLNQIKYYASIERKLLSTKDFQEKWKPLLPAFLS